MRWVDVAGPPGVGKSTICDPLWGPRDIGLADTYPVEWQPFLDYITHLMTTTLTQHPTFVAAVRMTRRSVRKMAAVSCLPSPPSGKPSAYIQTGFVQRGLGYGWRLVDLGESMDLLVPYFERMPLSIGVAFLQADVTEVEKRNADREEVPETAHENRTHMVEKMLPAIELANEVLAARDVPIITVDTAANDSATCRKEIINFASEAPYYVEATRRGGKVPVLRPPIWW